MIVTRDTRPNAPERRRGFTLVELLVAIVILGIISGMVAQALTGANRQAQETRAQAFINQLNLTMLRLYEEESRRRIGLPGQAWSAESANQTQLIWKRDWLRAALPMSRADIDAGAGTSFENTNYPATYRSGATVVEAVPFLSETGRSTISLTNDVRLSKSRQYRARVVRTFNAINSSTTNWATAFPLWSSDHESAECLYLIFASNTIDGKPLLDQLKTRDVADTDEDGMPEIVDPWGTPVRWMRSPAGFFLKNRWVSNEANTRTQPTVGELKRIVSELGPDPLDVLRSDPRASFVEDGNDADLIDPTAINPTIEIDKMTFFARPLIVSAGLDREFDLFDFNNRSSSSPPLPPNDVARTTVSDDRISTLAAPVRRFRNGSLNSHPLGYGSPVYFPDPFYSIAIVSGGGAAVDGIRPLVQRPGAVVDVDGDEIDDASDNIYPSLALQ